MAKIYHDIDIFGEENVGGTIKEYYDRDALKNALTLWLMSKKGDFIDAPDEGGILERFNFKNLTNETLEKMRFKIASKFNTRFSEVARLLNVSVKTNKTLRYTELYLTYRDLLNNTEETITIYPTDFAKVSKTSYDTIEFTGENLFNFVKIKKPDMQTLKIVFNISENCWIWGNRLKFVNFDFSDLYFEQILSYINT
jgi:hypothetical protein